MFTKAELELIRKIVSSAPIQGTVMTLPAALQSLVSILQKCEVEIARLDEVSQIHPAP